MHVYVFYAWNDADQIRSMLKVSEFQICQPESEKIPSKQQYAYYWSSSVYVISSNTILIWLIFAVKINITNM